VREMSTGIGVAVAALLLNFSRSLRHSPDLHLNDFRIAFVVTGALGALSIFAYARLAHDAGAEITGHRIADGERPAGSQT
jgi:hypothetical protein